MRMFTFIECLKSVISSVLVCSCCHNKVLQIGWLNGKNLFCHSSGVWKSEMKVPERLVPCEDSPW